MKLILVGLTLLASMPSFPSDLKDCLDTAKIEAVMNISARLDLDSPDFFRTGHPYITNDEIRSAEVSYKAFEGTKENEFYISIITPLDSFEQLTESELRSLWGDGAPENVEIIKNDIKKFWGVETIVVKFAKPSYMNLWNKCELIQYNTPYGDQIQLGGPSRSELPYSELLGSFEDFLNLD